jgi:YgiT-type zinc finger domain-containing protein
VEPYGDCVYCGGEIIEHKQQVDYRFHGQLFILENVPTGVCPQCGEQYFTAEVAKAMELAVGNVRGGVQTIPVPVIPVQS